MEAFYTSELQNVESPTYKLVKKFNDKQLFLSLKSLNFLLTCNNEEINDFLYLCADQNIKSAVDYFDEYKEENKKRLRNEFNYTYPVLKDGDFGDYKLKTQYGLYHDIYNPLNLENIKMYLNYIEVPTLYISLKGLTLINFDIDRAQTFSYFADISHIKDDNYIEFLEILLDIRKRMLLIMHFL